MSRASEIAAALCRIDENFSLAKENSQDLKETLENIRVILVRLHLDENDIRDEPQDDHVVSLKYGQVNPRLIASSLCEEDDNVKISEMAPAEIRKVYLLLQEEVQHKIFEELRRRRNIHVVS